MRVVTRPANTSCSGSQSLQPFFERTGLSVFRKLFLQQLHALAQKAVVVVKLEHVPRLAGVGVGVGVACRFECGDRNLVAANMIRVRIATVLVVRRHHVRLELADDADQFLGGFLERDKGEAALRQRRRRVTFGQTRVDEAQPFVLDAEYFGRLGHLVAPDFMDAAVHLGQVHRGVEDAAALAAGQRDHQHSVAFRGVASRRGRTLAGLIVRVGVDRQHPKFGHVFFWSLAVLVVVCSPYFKPYSSSPRSFPSTDGLPNVTDGPTDRYGRRRSRRLSRRWTIVVMTVFVLAPASRSPSLATSGWVAVTWRAHSPVTA